MKCTNKKIKRIVLIIAVTLSTTLAGCSGSSVSFDNKYSYKESATNVAVEKGIEGIEKNIDYFASKLCVGEDVFTDKDSVSDYVVGAMGVFLPASGEVRYSKNIYQKMYPASTTKILTAYIAITQGDLDSVVTASSNACDQPSDSSVCGLLTGDQITLGDLLYGLMLPSGNDAAIAIAEHMAGSVEAFAVMMNNTAKSLGATKSHFVNPNGLHDEDHYTTVYDMYLIFSKALTNETFVKYISTKSYTAYFSDANGQERVKTWTNTNKYVNGGVSYPSGTIPVGGKTGTTNSAGYCLVELSNDVSTDDKVSAPEPIITIIFKAGSRDDLYFVMNQLIRDGKTDN